LHYLPSETTFSLFLNRIPVKQKMSKLSTQEQDEPFVNSNAMEELLTQSPKNVVLPSSNKFPFWFGGSASAIATLLTHPLDLG
jgi:hypothetical protein